MATIDIVRAHDVGLEEAASRLRTLLEDFRSDRPELVKSISWARDGASADATGRGFKGHVTISDVEVRIAINLAMLMRPLRGKVEAGLNRRLHEAFGS